MRCPYCGGLNKDGVSFCSSCGRDLVSSVQNQQPPYPQRPPYPPVQQPTSPYPNPPRPPVTPPPMRAPGNTPPPPSPLRTAGVASSVAPSTPWVANTPRLPDPPAPFPPRTIEQLQALEPGALAYTVVEESIGNGRKKTVRITYPRAAAWQQVATLLKAFKEQQGQQADRFESIIIQGVQAGETNPYRFTSGQLCFDRRVRLGDRLLNRYQIETGSGFESDALRIVLSEEAK